MLAPSIRTAARRTLSRTRATPLYPTQHTRKFFDLRNLAGSSSSSSSTSKGRKIDRFPAPQGYSWPPNPPSPLPPSVNTYHDHQTLRYTPAQLYDIVSDVDSYNEFLPFCTASRVTGEVDSRDADVKAVHAELGVGFKGFQEKYTSLVEMKKGQWVRATALPHPLFQHLSTTWTFMPAPQGTQIIFELNYAFASPLYAALASGVFQELAGKMMTAFEQRAKQVYG